MAIWTQCFVVITNYKTDDYTCHTHMRGGAYQHMINMMCNVPSFKAHVRLLEYMPY